MAKKNNSSGKKSKSTENGYNCPKCKVFVEETQLEGLSLICPYCGSIM